MMVGFFFRVPPSYPKCLQKFSNAIRLNGLGSGPVAALHYPKQFAPWSFGAEPSDVPRNVRLHPRSNHGPDEFIPSRADLQRSSRNGAVLPNARREQFGSG